MSNSLETLVRREQVIDSYLSAHAPGEALEGHRDLVALAVHIAGVESASLNMIRAREHTVVTSPVLPPGPIPRDASLCARVVDRAYGPVHVPDCTLDDRFADSAMVTGEMAACRFYASFPLVVPGGLEVGTLCLFDEEVRRLDDAQVAALRMLAGRIVDLYELSVRERELAVAAEMLTVQASDLQHSVTLLESFTGQVGHDLKNPLASMRMSLEMLAESPTTASDPETAWLLDTSLSGLRRMDDMVSGCLTFARQGGRLTLGTVDLAEVLDEVEADLAVQRGDVALTRGPLPAVCADAAQLRMLVQNLVSNALKFTKSKDTPVVRVSAAQLPDGGFRLEVADNGPGLSPDDRLRCFGTRWQGRHDVPGLGLGLATCERIAVAHGGTIRVDEAPEGGALFTVEVPGTDGAEVPQQGRRTEQVG